MSYLPSFRLEGKKALVTGAGQALGGDTALGYGEMGADLALVGRRRAPLEEVAEQARTMGAEALVISIDLCEDNAGESVVARMLEGLGAVDILLNNAGTNRQCTSLEITPEQWDEISDTNLGAAFFMAQAAARAMVRAGRGGRIINIASQMAEVGFYKRPAYCASKAGVLGFTRTMAIELAGAGIRVNALGPTFIDSPLAREMFKDPGIAEEVMRRLPIGRLGRPEEVAAAAVFLASEGADLITGHHLLADGGWTAW